MSLLILFVIAVCLLVFAVKVLRRNKENPAKSQTEEAPTHFDLLDDDGNPINSSDDRFLSSEAPHIRVPVGSPNGENAPIHELKYFCVKDKGYHVSVWPKNQPTGGYIEFSIAGISYCGDLTDYLGEFIAILDPDPSNPYDANAIKILAPNGHHVGYVPRNFTDAVRDVSHLPCSCYAYIGENGGTYFSDCYIKI